MSLLFSVPKARRVSGAGPSRKTVLVAECDKERRTKAYAELANAGFEVFATSNGRDALLVCERFGGPIDLLIVGEDSLELRGAQLIEQAKRIRPRLKVMAWPADVAVNLVPPMVRKTLHDGQRLPVLNATDVPA